MNDVDRCLICGEVIPEGSQVCTACRNKYDIVTGETEEMAQELRDIADVLKITEGTDTNIRKSMESILRQTDWKGQAMARKEDKQPQYLPLIVKAKLHTGGRDYEKIKEELKGQGFTCKQMKGMVREGNYFDGIVLYLSKWNWDNHESWHLYNWDDKDDKEVMLGIYEAEQYHPQAPYRYRDNFEKFQKDWTSGEYDPGMTFTFKDSEVEVLEVLQEEVDNIDHEAVKKQVAAAEDAKFQKHRKQRQRRKQSASKGSRYQRKYF